MTVGSDLEFLLAEAEEALDVEGLLMLYELSWSMRGRNPELSPNEVEEVCTAAYRTIVSRHHLHLAWISWPQRDVVGDATGAPLSFEIDDEKAIGTPILALVPAGMLGGGSQRVPLRTVAESISELVEGRIGVFDVQVQLQQALGLLERKPGTEEIAAAMRAAESDLEAIQFTMLLEKQVPSAVAGLGRYATPSRPSSASIPDGCSQQMSQSPNLAGQRIAEVSASVSLNIATDAGWLLTIENEYELDREGYPLLSTAAGQEAEIVRVLLDLVGTTILSINYTDQGDLELALPGARLKVARSPDFEAWSLVGPEKERVVSMPGGGLAIWE